MPRIPSTPTVAKFVQTWSSDFKAAVKKAAGADGRLTLSEAQKLAQRPGADHVFADSAIAYLKTSGKKSVSVEVLTAEMKAYAQRSAEAVAGRDGKIGLREGAKLPTDLVEDFFLLRGKPAPTGPNGGTVAEAKAALEAAAAGLLTPSETDAPLLFVSGGKLNGPITDAVVRSQLGAQHDAVIGGILSGSDPLAKKTSVEVRDATAFFDQLTNNVDPNDPDSIARGQRFGQLKKVIDEQLTDVKVFRFGTISISTFVVGRTKSGELAGLLTGQVET
jgi:Nuclease A inhibitor-like protein